MCHTTVIHNGGLPKTVPRTTLSLALYSPFWKVNTWSAEKGRVRMYTPAWLHPRDIDRHLGIQLTSSIQNQRKFPRRSCRYSNSQSFDHESGALTNKLSRLPESILCADSYSVSVPPRVPQGHVKDPGHSATSAGGRLHLKTHTPLTQRSRSGMTMPLCRPSVGTLSGNELTRNSSGNTRLQSSQLAKPLWTNSGVKKRN